jgi:hypothetical protein
MLERLGTREHSALDTKELAAHRTDSRCFPRLTRDSQTDCSSRGLPRQKGCSKRDLVLGEMCSANLVVLADFAAGNPAADLVADNPAAVAADNQGERSPAELAA